VAITAESPGDHGSCMILMNYSALSDAKSIVLTALQVLYIV